MWDTRFIILSPPWAIWDNEPYNTSFAYHLLALSSFTYTLKDLPLPLMEGKE